MEAIGRIAKRGEAGAMAAVAARLADERWQVRRAAVEALGRIAATGDAGAMAAVSVRTQMNNNE